MRRTAGRIMEPFLGGSGAGSNQGELRVRWGGRKGQAFRSRFQEWAPARQDRKGALGRGRRGMLPEEPRLVTPPSIPDDSGDLDSLDI